MEPPVGSVGTSELASTLAADLPASDGARSRYDAGDCIEGRYRLVSPLGRGGMGEVWRAEHVHLHVPVAIKFFIRALKDGSPGMEFARERFRFEAQVSAQLGSKTRHIVHVHDAGVEERGPFLVMELVRGRSLEDLIDREGALDPHRVSRILSQVGDALGVAHAAGIVHRDLKPGNILIASEDGGTETAKLSDFGIAKAIDTALRVDRPQETTRGTLLGSPAYMSPEQLQCGTVDPRADLWALAVVAYEALTGGIPFESPSQAELLISIMTRPFQAPSKSRPHLPPGLDRWFERALSKEREGRFASAQEMTASLREIVEAHRPVAAPQRASAPPSAEMATAPSLPAPPRRRRPLWLYGGALAAVVAAGAAVLHLARAVEGPTAPVAAIAAPGPHAEPTPPVAADPAAATADPAPAPGVVAPPTVTPAGVRTSAAATGRMAVPVQQPRAPAATPSVGARPDRSSTF